MADGRPDVWGMNRHMVTAWNEAVGPEDVVIHAGDVFMGPWREWAAIRAQLNGRIILVKGNHDRKLSEWMLPGDFAMETLTLRDGTFITHVPPGGAMAERTDHYGIVPHPVPAGTKLILHGHTHHARPTKNGNLWSVEVGVDVMGFAPLTFSQVLRKAATLNEDFGKDETMQALLRNQAD